VNKPPKTRRQIAENAGRKAENYAAFYLRLKGYQILEKRFKTRQGEIDLIARKGGVLVFTEVKKRTPFLSLAGFGDALSIILIFGGRIKDKLNSI